MHCIVSVHIVQVYVVSVYVCFSIILFIFASEFATKIATQLGLTSNIEAFSPQKRRLCG